MTQDADRFSSFEYFAACLTRQSSQLEAFHIDLPHACLQLIFEQTAVIPAERRNVITYLLLIIRHFVAFAPLAALSRCA
jgi:hypothetical protein